LRCVAAVIRLAQAHRAAAQRVLYGAYDQPLAQLRRPRIAEGDHLGKVMPGIDMQQRKREPARPKGPFRQTQKHDRILAAGEEENWVGAFARDLAKDENRFRLEPVQMRAARRSLTAAPGARLLKDGAHAGALIGTRRPPGDTCRPHSRASSFSHHQRPARTSSPATVGRVQGAQPMER